MDTILEPYFNSIKVRLELCISCQHSSALAKFQFHKGTIRTLQVLYAVLQAHDFNSIKVRLELSADRREVVPILISIP